MSKPPIAMKNSWGIGTVVEIRSLNFKTMQALLERIPLANYQVL
jgi:hypothetical protein